MDGAARKALNVSNRTYVTISVSTYVILQTVHVSEPEIDIPYQAQILNDAARKCTAELTFVVVIKPVFCELPNGCRWDLNIA